MKHATKYSWKPYGNVWYKGWYNHLVLQPWQPTMTYGIRVIYSCYIGICTYMLLFFMVNVGEHWTDHITIHWVFGYINDTSPSKPIQLRTNMGPKMQRKSMFSINHCQAYQHLPTNGAQPSTISTNQLCWGLTHGSNISKMACIRENRWLSIGQNHIAQVCEHVFSECTC